MDKIASNLDSVQQNKKTSVYLQTSKDIYVSGEDLWFNAFVLDAQLFTPSSLDKTVYIKLQNDSDSTIWKEMYPIKNGISSGHVYLPLTLPDGNYLLKAYTAHSFSNSSYFYAIAPIRIVKELKSINIGQKINETNQTQNGKIQFNLFPEGGDLVTGLVNHVAFKAVNAQGNPMDIFGTLLKNGAPLVDFNTSHAGMGRFTFFLERNATYQIKLNNSDSVYALPNVSTAGILMHLTKNEQDTLVFKVLSNQVLDKKRIFLRLQVRGIVQAIATATLTDSIEIRIPVKNSLQGIAEATIFDDSLRPLAERLVYLHPEQQLSIGVENVSQVYPVKGKVSIKVKTTGPTDQSLPSVISLRVFDQLFYDSSDVNDIVSHYLLSTQLRGSVYNPSYYFDTTKHNRIENLDILLTTQGWRRYTWNEEHLSNAKSSNNSTLSDSLSGSANAARNGKKEKFPLTLMLFNYNRSNTQISATDNTGRFYLTPENLSIAPRIFIKYFSENDYHVTVDDPFKAIVKAENNYKPQCVISRKMIDTDNSLLFDASNLLQYGKVLETVTIVGKGRGYNDRYLGYLDSIAKYEGNTDYVGSCGWLNCPACNSGKKPVEGVTYSELIEPKRSQVSSHPFSFKTDEMRKVVYHYPKYTEEELLKKFKMTVTKGYYNTREFYEPNYDIQKSDEIDQRNTLLWKPQIFTDENGEATVTFFCSDITSRFVGFIEGVSENGLLGFQKIAFSVRK
ncbi:MAG: hypothetical protein M9933_17905 [Chitinophagaceae bacterium]|nr:hypothetical protein [Chitinophagaceae bacterium]